MQRMPIWLATMINSVPVGRLGVASTPASYMSYNRNGKPSGAAAAKRAAKKRRNIAKHN